MIVDSWTEEHDKIHHIYVNVVDLVASGVIEGEHPLLQLGKQAVEDSKVKSEKEEVKTVVDLLENDALNEIDDDNDEILDYHKDDNDKETLMDTNLSCVKNDHVTTDTKEPSHYGMLCDFKGSKRLVKNHINRLHKAKIDPEENIKHYMKKIDIVKGPCICDFCYLKSDTKKLSFEHIKAQHNKEMYKCKQRNYRTKKKVLLKKHNKDQHEGTKHTYPECEYSSSQKSNLKVHIQAAHEKMIHYCDLCDYKARHKQSVTKHVKFVHEGITFSYDQCDYTARDDRELQNTSKMCMKIIHISSM